MQAKMMMWLMPVVFTVMMLFLPAALGVYMLTNSVLGITQQLAVEKLSPAARGGAGRTRATKPGKGGDTGGSRLRGKRAPRCGKKDKRRGHRRGAANGKSSCLRSTKP